MVAPSGVRTRKVPSTDAMIPMAATTTGSRKSSASKLGPTSVRPSILERALNFSTMPPGTDPSSSRKVAPRAVNAMVAMMEPTYDSKRSAPMPATSPTLSPTLSATVAGLRGSSSGMPASTFPTRSAPTSAALVYIPPPTLANRAMDEAPKPKPAMMLMSLNIQYMAVMPSSPMATTETPMTVPLLKATRRAGFSPCCALTTVREFALMAMLIPMKPARAEPMAPTR